MSDDPQRPLFALNLMLLAHDDHYLLRAEDVERSHELKEFIQSIGWTLDEAKRGYVVPRVVLPFPERPPTPPPETM